MRLAFSFLCIFIYFATLSAQQDAVIAQPWSITSYVNPAAVGFTDYIQVTALSRLQWMGIAGAPKTLLVKADMPFRALSKRHGLGIVLNHDEAGLFAHTDFGLDYAYHLKMRWGQLSLGLRLGASSQAFDATKIEIPDTEEGDVGEVPLPQEVISAMAFDAAFGVNLSTRYLSVGLSTHHLTAPVLELDQTHAIRMDRAYYLLISSNIAVKNTLFTLSPSLYAQTTFQFTQVAASLRLSYRDRFWTGVSYRLQDAVTFMLGGSIKAIRVGYAYDLGLSDLGRSSGGSHELFVSYAFKLDLRPKLKTKHKSVRIL